MDRLFLIYIRFYHQILDRVSGLIWFYRYHIRKVGRPACLSRFTIIFMRFTKEFYDYGAIFELKRCPIVSCVIKNRD